MKPLTVPGCGPEYDRVRLAALGQSVSAETPSSSSAGADRLTLGTTAAYGLGLAALNLVMTIISTYLLYFYTDVAGLKASSVGTMFLFSRLFGCVAYVGLGVMLDKTNTRWGKSRPYLLWAGAPLGIVCVLTVVTPHFSGIGNLIYAYVTYNALIILLSVVNLALGAIVPCMTSHLSERSRLGGIGAFFGIGGLLSVSYATLPLVKFLGHGNQALGFRLTAALYALLTFVFLLIAFCVLKEKVKPLRTGSIPAREQVASAIGNTPWHMLMLSQALFWIVVIMHTQTTVYFLKYNVHRPDLVPLVMATLVAALPGSMCCVAVSKRLGKRNAMQVSCLIAVVGLLVTAASTSGSIGPLIVGNLIFSFGKGIIIGLFIAMFPDTVDFGEWRTNVWVPGLIYAGIALAQNIGMGIGGALSSWLLATGSYVPNVEQSARALRSIELTYIWVPLAAMAVMAAMLGFYRLDRRIKTIKTDLEARRLSAAS